MRAPELIALSATTEGDLEAASHELVRYLGAHPEIDLADLARSLSNGRAGAHRRALLARDAADALAALQTRESPHHWEGTTRAREHRLGFAFPGQGTQYPGMAAGLYDAYPQFREQVDTSCEVLRSHLGFDLREKLLSAPGSDGDDTSLRETLFAQTSLFVIEHALAELLVGFGLRPGAMIGHSIGEFVAACLAGVFALEDALAVVATRARLMQELPRGAMIAVNAPADAVGDLLSNGISLAAVNAPTLCVLAGDGDAVDHIEKELSAREVPFRRLHTSHAFHSQAMEPAVAPFVEAVSAVRLSPPRIPFVSNLTGAWIRPEQATDPAYWGRHLREAVRFGQGLDTLLADPDLAVVEVGPGNALATLARQSPARRPTHAFVQTLPRAVDGRAAEEELLEAVGRLWVGGATVDWKALRGGDDAGALALPPALSPGGDVVDAYPLTPMQNGMLFQHAVAPASGVDIFQVVATLPERLDVEAFAEAWRLAIRRFPVLRTSFRWKSVDEPEQEVHESAELVLDQEDWRGLSAEEQERKLAAHVAEERRRGFDLGRLPISRVALFRTADDEYRCVWTTHHILIDGAGLAIVVGDLFRAYDAFRRGGSPDLPATAPFREHVEWLRERPREAAEEYWRGLLKGFRAPNQIHVARPVDPWLREPGRFRERKRRLSPESTERLRAAASAWNVTVNTLVQGAFGVLLSHYSSDEDVVFGALRACRHTAAERAGDTVGPFINTLPLRLRVARDRPVSSWLQEIRAQHVALADYEQTPLDRVQAWSEVPAGEQLFQTFLLFENRPTEVVLSQRAADPEEDPGRSVRVLPNQTNFSLSLHARLHPELELTFAYYSDEFDDGDVERMLESLEVLLEAMAAGPDLAVGDLPLLSDGERRRLLVDWAREDADYPRDACVQELFEAQAERTPDAVALLYEDAELRYRELDSRANRLARRLRTAGVGPDAPVAVCMERSLEAVVGMLAILKAGGAYLPLDPSYPEKRLRFMLEDSGASVLLTKERFADSLPEPATRSLLDRDWPDIERESDAPLEHAVGPDHLAYVTYTSGSTGIPKGVEVPHRGVARLLFGASYASFGPDETFLQLSAMTFDLLTFELWGALLHGGRCVLAPEGTRTPQQIGDLIHRHGITTAWLTGSLYNMVIDEDPEALRGLRQLLIGGEALSPVHVRKGLAALPETRFINGYGPTENTTFSSCHAIPRDLPAALTSIPIGKTIANSQVYVLDDRQQPVPIGVPGELCVGGAGVARGYRGRPALTAERFVPDPFGTEPGARLYRTGDRVRWLPDATLEFLGRFDHQVKVRGYRIELGEIEATLASHPDVRDAVVRGFTDARGNENLAAWVVPANQPDPTPDELATFLRRELPSYMVPASFVTLPALPLNPSGKVDATRLPDPSGERPDLSAAYVAPRDDLEHDLAELWREVLRIDRVGLHDNFFDLGGDSLLLVRIHGRLPDGMDQRVSIVDLFRYPSIGALAAFLRGGSEPEARLAESEARGRSRREARREQGRRRREGRAAASRRKPR